MADIPTHHEDHPEVITRTARRGLILFAIYFAMYMAFLLLNIFSPESMAKTAIPISSGREISLGGPNVAVVSGIGLIFMAILLSLVYMRWTRQTPPPPPPSP